MSVTHATTATGTDAGNGSIHKAEWNAAHTVSIAETDLSFTDITTANVSTTKHGLAPKGDGTSTHYLDGTGAYSTPASSGLSGGTPALTLSTSNSAGAAATGIRTDATIAAFDTTAPVTQAFGDAAATGSAGTAARRDHKHGMPASVTFHGCKAYSDTTQSISSATMTAATLNQEEYDTDSFHDNVTNNTRMTIPTGMTGYYRLTGYAQFANSSGACIIQFYKNGTTTLRSQPVVAGGTTFPGMVNTTVVSLSAADYVEMRVYHSQAGSSNIGDAVNVEQQTFFSIELVGV